MRFQVVFPVVTLIILSVLTYYVYYNQRLLENYHKLEASSTVESSDLKQALDDKNQIERMMKTFRQADKAYYDSMMMNLTNKKEEDLVDHFFKVMTESHQGVCRTAKRVGGGYIKGYKAVDGDKIVCLDRIMRSKSCLIYSFGINNDWTFEDLVADMGCDVFAYDHTIDAPPTRGSKIRYFKNGIGGTKDGQLDTLHNFMEANGHQKATIDYLKMDVEGYEFHVLPQIVKDGTIDKIDQIAMELHCGGIYKPPKFKWVLELFQTLYLIGFRLISYVPNTAMGRDGSADNYYTYMEIVLKRDNEWNYLD